MKRSIRIAFWVLALFCFGKVASAADDPSQRTSQEGSLVERSSRSRLNVLFLVSDDLRPELGCYGNEIIQSPSIDRLASKGVVFNRAYCQQAVCSPSRTSVMTGMRPDTTQVWDLRTHFRKAIPDVVTLPQLFKQHGYETLGLGKIYHAGVEDPISWTSTSASRTSENTRESRQPPTETAVVSAVKTQVEKKTRKTSGPKKSEAKPDRKRGPAFRVSDDPPNGGSEGKLADDAIRALKRFKAQSTPFFLAVGFHKPHLPFVAPRAYWDLYDPAQIPPAPNQFLPKNAPPFALVDRNEMWKYAGVPDQSHLPESYARQLKHGYYAAVSYMDAQLGRVLNELESLGLAESTIVVLWGDHGWKLGEHDRWCKHSNVEDDARAPLIVYAPKMNGAGRKTDAVVEFVDIFPTIAGLAGLPVSDRLEGRSLQPLLHDPDCEWESAAISQYPRTVDGKRLMGYSLRTDRYRFTRWVDRNDHTEVIAVELYDHTTDPQENSNIANDPANAELVKRLTRQWVAHPALARKEAQ